MTLTFLLTAAMRERVLRGPQVVARIGKAFAASILVLSGRLALEPR